VREGGREGERERSVMIISAKYLAYSLRSEPIPFQI
jgi:hypothetical protein